MEQTTVLRRGRYSSSLVLGLLLALLLVLWAPALFGHRTIIHGDSIFHGLALMQLHAQALQGDASLLWSSDIYGGHPLHAEGQGGFAHPLNIVFAWLITPWLGAPYSMNLFHVLGMLLTGIGVLGLCRTLGASAWSASFAAVAVMLSNTWIHAHHNVTIAASVIWVPFVLWAMEAWLQRPTLRSAALFGITVALTLLAGYPQALHGALIYAFASLLPIPFQALSRRAWVQSWRVRVGTGVMAILLALGLAAVQWLPTLELVKLSHRSGGVDIAFPFAAASYYRGLLFSVPEPLSDLGYYPVLGSLLVCLVASLAVFSKAPRLIGHLIATVLLIQLGLENSSPLYLFLRDHVAFLGLQWFRVAQIYFNVAVVGIGVLAALALDAMARWGIAGHEDGRPPISVSAAVGAMTWLALWVLIVVKLRTPDASWVQYAIVLAALIAGMALIVSGRAARAPMLMVILLTLECIALRLRPFHFADPQLLAKPTVVAALQRRRDVHDYKLYDKSSAILFAFTNPISPALDQQMPRMLTAISASSNLLWQLPSINGAHALPLQRRMDAEPVLQSELQGDATRSPGFRLIDQLGVRFVSADEAVSAAALRPFWHDSDRQIWIMENTAALPRFRLYSRHLSVNTAEEAVTALRTLSEPVLIVEDPGRRAPSESTGRITHTPAARLEVLLQGPMRYRFRIATAQPIWLFVSDANYPGWHAAVDGRPVPLFSAQLLGKAVHVPTGTHEVSMAFDSGTFRTGLWISLGSLVLTVVVLGHGCIKHAGRKQVR